MKRVHVFVYGIVHGVGFRYFIKENAKKFNVNGFVRNIHNEKGDAVECVFEGKDENVEKMIELCKKGPESAVVKDIEIFEEKFMNEFKDFKIKFFGS